MTGRRSMWVAAGFVLCVGCAAWTCAAADKSDSKLLAQAAQAERILLATPEPQAGREGNSVDVAPGSQFLVEINRVIRGTGRKSAPALIVNGGDKNQHPKYTAGRQYLFLLKKNPNGKGWLNLSAVEIPVHDGKAQWLVDGKPVEEVPLAELDELGSRDVQPVERKEPKRDSLTGRWIVVLSRPGADEYLWLVEFSPAEKPVEKPVEKPDEKQGTAARLVSSSRLIHASTLKSAAVEGPEVWLAFEADGESFDFKGRFENGAVRGNVLVGPSLILPSRMLPTEAKNLSKYADPIPDAARPEFIEASQQEDHFGPLLRFVRRHPDSPLSLAAYADLIALAGKQGYDREKVEALGESFLKSARVWGPRLELLACVSVGVSLSRRDELPELALEYLTTASQRLDETTPRDLREIVGVERGRRLIAAGRTEEGVELLRKVREEFPFQADATFALARQLEKDGQIDEALALFGELATLPQAESQLVDALKSSGRKLSADEHPRRVVTRLWTQKHGDRKGLSAYLDGLYESRIRSIAGEKRAPRGPDEGSRIAICELFTGGACTQCVATDVATIALEATYEKSELIVLRYHENIPRPDPLANDDTKTRFEMYRREAPPAMVLNGRPLPTLPGSMQQAPEIYRRMRAEIDAALEEKISLRLELSAVAKGGKIAISAEALGLSTFPANSKLELVLAEDRTEWLAPSGIRFHEMVVRDMPGGVMGIDASAGKLSYTGEVDLAKLKSKLARQLAKTEEEAGRAFDEKPLELKSLHLVGMLQNSETGEILQAAAVPVSGLSDGQK